MDLTIHPKAPTQVTCAHCQRTFSRQINTRQPLSLSLEGAAHYTSAELSVNSTKRQGLHCGHQAHACKATLAELQQVFAASLQGQFAVVDHSAIDTHGPLAELAQRF